MKMKMQVMALCFVAVLPALANDSCQLVVPVVNGDLSGIDAEVATILYKRGYEVEYVDELTDESIDGRNYITYSFSGKGSWYYGYRCDGRLTVNKVLSTGTTVKLFEDTYSVQNDTNNFSTCKRSYEVLASKVPICRKNL